MKFTRGAIPGVVIVEPDVYRDDRGFFCESYHAQKYREGGIPATFVQDNHSRSVKGTLRGLHFQTQQTQGKLIRVIEGEVFDVLVDCRRGSPAFKRWEGLVLSADNFKQIYAPPGLLHGFCVLSETAQLEYKCTDFYHPRSEISVIWNDSDLNIDWPVKNPSLSKKDAAGFRFADVLNKFPSFAKG